MASLITPGKVIHCTSRTEYYSCVEAAGDRLILVYCFANNAPCHIIVPVFASLASKYPNALCIQVDMEQDPNMVRILNVETMPSFVFLKSGERVSSFVGANEKTLKKGLEKSGKISKLGILRR
eukprot:scaffold142449_cov50-Attheya_sp.AAC.4